MSSSSSSILLSTPPLGSEFDTSINTGGEKINWDDHAAAWFGDRELGFTQSPETTSIDWDSLLPPLTRIDRRASRAKSRLTEHIDDGELAVLDEDYLDETRGDFIGPWTLSFTTFVEQMLCAAMRQTVNQAGEMRQPRRMASGPRILRMKADADLPQVVAEHSLANQPEYGVPPPLENGRRFRDRLRNVARKVRGILIRSQC
ncbi:hypothetical protein BD324DRAFT_649009 [Kockovaella imperatae]|uniref:Uncharacterized protein n=1 Tax=Kockovaella imperatae TaxID=4999 RepID=A0A1Y1ULI7_9TREE|nr:hypothetical protein BD324DRAFT_649009 [Kockovaella imperatae]ORX38910.1 hypothetical protein BD324DRAFT_649009 [Kockovaella imperatae]